MDGFLNWFFAFMTVMIDGLWDIISGLFGGFIKIFGIPAYLEQFSLYSKSFNVLDWILAILAVLLVLAVWFIIIFLIVLGIRKYIRFRRSVVGNEDILQELADMHRDVLRLTKEKEKIMALKIGQTSIPVEAINEIFRQSREEAMAETGEYSAPAEETANELTASVIGERKPEPQTVSDPRRFYRLAAVDDKYEYYVEPSYRSDLTLSGICEEFRNFACSKMNLYYDLKTIRLMFAGLASTKLILLQGISGTGKTSLPYAMGKFFENNATIASVQPSWRDRTELFGYFNEFTKRYNETEVLRRIYESSYNDDINIIVLDEMNIARVEYYFAEMLSILEMPDMSEWKLELVPSSWDSDPKHLKEGKLTIPPNVWYIGTANNDDSTFSVSDKVYDRAFTINLDSKGVPFDAPKTEPSRISYSYVERLYKEAIEAHPVSESLLSDISKLDIYVIQKFRVAFGNRIVKQLQTFVPVYVAAGGTELEGVDYILATKVFRKFESLNLSVIRDEIDGLIDYLDSVFGKDTMNESIVYLRRLKKMY
ncbi:MAG: hypothetical protein PUC29_04405 [Clostridia bacterium]|nr:hypothetical protein [Clostridia bacterium]